MKEEKIHPWFEQRLYGFINIPVHEIIEHPDRILEMFNKLKIIVFRTTNNFLSDCVEYEVICPFFRAVPLGEKPPEYMIIVHRINSETFAYTVKEVK